MRANYFVLYWNIEPETSAFNCTMYVCVYPFKALQMSRHMAPNKRILDTHQDRQCNQCGELEYDACRSKLSIVTCICCTNQTRGGNKWGQIQAEMHDGGQACIIRQLCHGQSHGVTRVFPRGLSVATSDFFLVARYCKTHVITSIC